MYFIVDEIKGFSKTFWGMSLCFFTLLALAYMLFLQYFVIDGNETAYSTRMQRWYYFAGLYIFGYIYSICFRLQQEEAFSAFSLTIERWFKSLLVMTVLFPLIYSFLFYLLTAPASELSRISHLYSDPFDLFLPLRGRLEDSLNTYFDEQQIPFFLIYLSICGTSLALSLIFKRFIMTKTLLAGTIITGILWLLCNLFPINEQEFIYWFGYCDYVFTWQGYVVSVLTWVVIPCLLWLTVYLALKARYK